MNKTLPATSAEAGSRTLNDMAYWFPRLLEVGVPVPKTELVQTGLPLIGLCEGQPPPGFDAFLRQLEAAAAQVGGFPVFLRTGQTSGKHSWKDTCHVRAAADLPRHVAALVEFSEMADFFGLPYHTWAVRELLTSKPDFTAFRGGMPIRRERRLFVEGGQVICRHGYWPEEAIEGQAPSDPNWRQALRAADAHAEAHADLLTRQSERVSACFAGAWSLDWLWDEDRATWFAIDMAVAGDSYHWPQCPNVHRWSREAETGSARP